MINESFIRWYDKDLKRMPSVTSILMLLPQPQYISDWIERIGVEGYNNHINKIMERGTVLHKVCENFFRKNNNPIPTDFEYQKFINGFHTFVSKFGSFIKPRLDGTYGIEEKVYSDEHCYAGTMDFVCNLNGILTLIDWKTSSSSRITGQMKDKYLMQCVAYAKAYNLTHDDKIKKIMIVVLTSSRKDGLGEIIELQESSFLFYWTMFIPLLIEFNLTFNNNYYGKKI